MVKKEDDDHHDGQKENPITNGQKTVPKGEPNYKWWSINYKRGTQLQNRQKRLPKEQPNYNMATQLQNVQKTLAKRGTQLQDDEDEQTQTTYKKWGPDSYIAI